MRIRITKELPVEEAIRPAVGEVFEVVGRQEESTIKPARRRPAMYSIQSGLARVGVLPDECEIVEG